MSKEKFNTVGPLTPFKVTSKWSEMLWWLREKFGDADTNLDVPIQFRYTIRTLVDESGPEVFEAAVAFFSLHKTEIHRYDWEGVRHMLDKLGFSIAAKAETGCIEYTIVEESNEFDD